MAAVTIERLKSMLVENCMVKVDPQTILEETPLFGPESIGLDSLDALQMTIAVEKEYGVAIGDPATARDALQSLGVLRDWISSRQSAA
jgi:acyl carrier protein